MNNNEGIMESKILHNWGTFIHNELRPGPGERYDSETGEWGTKAQALGNLVNSGRDEQDEPRWAVENVDDCWIMQEVVHSQHPEYKAILFGWFCEHRYDITACLDRVQRKPLINSKSRYRYREDFEEVCNKAIVKAERDFAIEKSKRTSKRSL